MLLKNYSGMFLESCFIKSKTIHSENSSNTKLKHFQIKFRILCSFYSAIQLPVKTIFGTKVIFSFPNKIATSVIGFYSVPSSLPTKWCRWEIASYWQSEQSSFFSLLPCDTLHTNTLFSDQLSRQVSSGVNLVFITNTVPKWSKQRESSGFLIVFASCA